MAKKKYFAFVPGPVVGKGSKEARDFAIRATNKLAPWVTDHYKVWLRDERNFSHHQLFEYHLRGDHFIGLTRDNAAYDDIGLGQTNSGGNPRFVNNPSRPLGDMYGAPASEFDFRQALINNQPYRGVGEQTQFSVYPVTAERDTRGASDFLIKELINSTSLIHMTMQELGSMTYSLLPFAGTQVYEATMEYILDFIWDVLTADDSILRMGTIHPMVEYNNPGAEYEATALALNVTALELTGSPIPPSYQFPCSIPLYLVSATVRELQASGVPIYATGDVRTHLQNLFINAYSACVTMRDDNDIREQKGEARYRSNKDKFNQTFRGFLKSYFDTVVSKYPLGTTITLAKPDYGGVAREISTATGVSVAAIQNHNEYVITATRVVKKNKKLKQEYQLSTTLPAAARYRPTKYVSDVDDKQPAFVFSSDPNIRRTVEVAAPVGIIGRAMLTHVIHLNHIASYFVAQRDFRRLSVDDVPGSYEKLPTAGTITGGRVPFPLDVQKQAKQGLLDYYVEIRLEFMAAYLVGLYDSLQPSMREQMVRFYESDMFANEFAYYSSVVSNYISSKSNTEEHIEPISGRMSVYKEPEGEVGAGNRFFYTQPVAPESVYYKLESPMLRLIYRDYVGRFYDWYVALAMDLDQGRRNFTPSGLTKEAAEVGIKEGKGSKDKYKKRIQPTQAILKQMWPLLKSRATEAVKEGRASSHQMMRALAEVANTQRSRLNLATPLVPFSTTFIDFGALLSDPRKYNLPPSLDPEIVSDFITFLESVYFTSYDMVGALATAIEATQAANLSRDALIEEFEKKYASFRKTKVVNQFTWPASAELVHLFREFTSIPSTLRAELAAEEADAMAAEAMLASTTETPRREEDVGAARIAPARTTPIPLAIRRDP